MAETKDAAPAAPKKTAVAPYRFKDGSASKGHPGIFKQIAAEQLTETMIKALKNEDIRSAKAGRPFKFMDLIEKVQ